MARPGFCPQPPVRAVTIARGAAASAIIAGSAAAVCAERSTLRTGLEAIGHARPGWVAAGVALEFVSMAAFALLQQRLLKAAGAKSALASLLATDYTSNAIAAAIDRVGSLRLDPWSTVCLLAYGAINWSADAFCLAAAIGAVGVPIPWDKLLLAWSAGVGASSFSPTPFGLGVVEAALIAALAAAGINSPDAVGAVLIYRVMTFKLLGLIWVLALHLRGAGKLNVSSGH